ncbi:MAG: hypothetical protein HYR84_02130 [Planctomycetes bacterium]|nr:hypothetical protein [Planctomycetota bacterium]
MNPNELDIAGPDIAPATEISDAAEVLAWEEISAGRYMPRRIRGSCKGRVLG